MSRTQDLRPAIARGLDAGLTDAEIAAIVGVTPYTVARHRRALGVHRKRGGPGPGRPPVVPGAPRSERIDVAVTVDEAARVRGAAVEAGTSPGDWLVRAAGVRK